jgi:glutamyl-tRNA synthetase
MASAPRVRFAPSPTGYLHIGGARTALFNWLHARRRKGTFILRVEDTDQQRSTEESLNAVLDALRWLKLEWDEGPEKGGKFGPYFQSQRLHIYQEWAEKLIAEDKAYRCYCSRELLEERRALFEREKRTYKYEGTCRNLKNPPVGKPSVIRLKLPPLSGSVTFTDKVLGKISKPAEDLDDWVMLRADGTPVYNFSNVIDDHLMEISLVARGQEHVNSTFPQLLLYQTLGWKVPEFAHVPLILGADREKLSKRKHAEADVMMHARNGILPEALLNFIVRLGWSHGDDEVISREQMIEWFDFADVGAASGVWNPEKLLWLNQHYLKTLDAKDLARRLAPFVRELGFSIDDDDGRLERVVVVLRERTKTLKEMAEVARYFFSKGVRIDEKAAAKHLTPDAKSLLQATRGKLANLPQWTPAEIEAVVKKVAEEAGVSMGKVAQPIRVAATGGTVSPGIGETLEIIGRDETLARLDAVPH